MIEISICHADSKCEIPAQTSHKGDAFIASNQEQAERVKREYLAGSTAFKKQDYNQALAHFLGVYRISAHPNLVYNIAVSFEKLKKYEKAIQFYQCYLELEPQSENRTQVNVMIKTLTALKEEEKQKAQVEPVVEPEKPRVLAWSGVALGGLTFMGGVVLGSRALALDSDLDKFQAGDSSKKFYQIQRQRDHSALYSDVFTISGAVITGVSLYFALRNTPKTTSNIEVSPSASSVSRTSNSGWLSDVQVGVNGHTLTVSGAF